MYSLVLMTAIATSGDAASFHKRSTGCNGCSGAPIVYSVGCYGSATPIGCTGCRGCTGCSGFTAYSTSCFGCCGGCFGSGWSCTGCCGGMARSPSSNPIVVPPAAPMAEPNKVETEKKSTATLKLELPADAKLFVDGQPIDGDGAVRNFSTPELPVGRNYYYDMRAETTVNGTPVREEIRLVVRAGDALTHTFGELIAKAQAAKDATVTRK